MRKFHVIVVSSISAHADLTAHASTKLDLTKSLLGLHSDFTQSANFADLKPTSSQLPNSSFSFRQQDPDGERTSGSQFRKAAFAGAQKPIEQIYPELMELHDLPPPRGRPRSHSVFSGHDPRKFDGFASLSENPMTPKMQSAFTGLGDGPLFPRPRPLSEERARAESIPPHVAYSSNLGRSVFFPFAEDEGSPPSVWKGKDRENLEPEPAMPQTADAYSASAFEPFAEAMMHFQASPTLPNSLPKEQMIQDILTSSTSSSSRSSKFSIIHHSDTTALTSAATATDKNVGAFEDTGKVVSGFEYEIDSAALELPGEEFSLQETSTASSDRNSSATIKPEKVSSPPKETVAASEGNSAATTKAEKATSPYAPPPLITEEKLPRAGKISSSSKYISPASSIAPPPPATTTTPNTPPVTKPSTPKPVLTAAQPVRPSPTPLPKVTASTSKPPPAQPQPKVAEASNLSPAPTPSHAPLLGTAAQFQPLVAVLRRVARQFPGGVPKTRLGTVLPQENPQVYRLANVKKFAPYIAAAVNAGIVQETQHDCVTLMPTYA